MSCCRLAAVAAAEAAVADAAEARLAGVTSEQQARVMELQAEVQRLRSSAQSYLRDEREVRCVYVCVLRVCATCVCVCVGGHTPGGTPNQMGGGREGERGLLPSAAVPALAPLDVLLSTQWHDLRPAAQLGGVNHQVGLHAHFANDL